ncbi:MAG: enoyl-CoA hydratase-related protein [Candidatus Thermoplasmatota archaeon]
MAEPVKTRLDDGILTVTLARPEKKNALDLVTLGQLQGALEQASRDPAVRVVVLAAEGDMFSGGGDINVMKEFAGDAQATLTRLRTGLNRLVTLLHDLPKPVVAAVQGNAYGAGAILAFQCDLAVVADDATFSLSFRHVGLVPDTGGTWLLPRIVGLQRAKHLTWTAAPFSAADAVHWGLALKSVPRAQLEGTVRNLAAALADGPAATMGLAKQALHRNLASGLPEALDREARTQAAAFLTPEHAEGRDAFFERRKPKFR